MRTKKVAKNLIISVIMTTLIAIIGLFKTKFFLNYLGAEMTGIYQLFTQIFSYISLVDAGLTSSILFCLYEPISKNDTKKINAILKGGRNFYNKIALIIIALGFLVSFKLDFFITGYNGSLTYIRICFILFIISNAINYFVTSRKVILEAKQNLYKVHLVVYSTMIISGILEMILLSLNFKLQTIMILLVFTSIIQNLIIIYVSNKDYPDLDYNVLEDKSFIKQTKNLIVQKFSNIVFNNVDIILISKYIGTASIVIYSSYMYVINSLQNVVKKIGSSALASVGNLLVSESEKSRDVFYEYNSLCFYIANIICVPLLIVITPFVSLFYGEAYILSFAGSLFVVMILYFKIIEIPLSVFTDALGYFSKVKKCIILQSFLNLTLSIVFLFKYNIAGILFATVISYIIGLFALYPKILNDNYFQNYKIKYYSQSIKFVIIGIVSFILLFLITRNININNFIIWFLVGLGTFTINLIIITIYFHIFGELKFMNRLKQLKKGGKNEKK